VRTGPTRETKFLKSPDSSYLGSREGRPYDLDDLHRKVVQPEQAAIGDKRVRFAAA
jgi:hypothetical protein